MRLAVIGLWPSRLLIPGHQTPQKTPTTTQRAKKTEAAGSSRRRQKSSVRNRRRRDPIASRRS